MLVLLDRDGVLNEDLPQGVTCVEEFRFLPGALAGIALLTQAGFRLAIVSNQSGVAKGLLSEATLAEIHTRLREDVQKAGGRIDAIYVCTDHPDHPTERRKPNPGMVLEALHDFRAAATETVFVGDALRDLQAAAAAGCPRILVKTGKGQLTLNKGLPDSVQPVTVFETFTEAADYIVQHYGIEAEKCSDPF